MFHPVGSQPQSVYWRRRFVLLASLVVVLLLLILTVRAMTSGAAPSNTASGNSGPDHHRRSSPAGRPSTGRSAPSSSPMSSSHSRHAPPGAGGGTSGHRHRNGGGAAATSASSSTTPAPPPRCTAGQLGVHAVVAQSSYHVGQKPLVELQVTNTGAQPCVQDLSDRQIVLKVYNGESRVWGSHDCEIQPGTDDRTLAAGRPVRVSITWSGLTSQPGCSGTRQRVGAGTYTLYAYLSGHEGTAAQFSIV